MIIISARGNAANQSRDSRQLPTQLLPEWHVSGEHHECKSRDRAVNIISRDVASSSSMVSQKAAGRDAEEREITNYKLDHTVSRRISHISGGVGRVTCPGLGEPDSHLLKPGL